MHRLLHMIAAMALLLTGCAPDMPREVSDAYKKLSGTLDYNTDVKPILSDKCFSCHGPDKAKQKAGLRLDQPESAYDELREHPGKVAIAPGDAEGSELFSRIMSDDPDYRMPTPASHHKLSATEKAVLTKWIEQGAKYASHWAFVPPVMPAVPPASDPTWKEVNPIDRFIQQKLKTEGLHPAGEAPKELLLRRVFLDLTGLPPTPAQIDSFLADASPNAYEKQVDQLFASPHYGEKMAVDWLDVARYADSHGYTVDRLRDMSPYRDWVINAFNRNMPYDRFVTEQLAGDLMLHPTRDMRIATAFNRNHPQNMEGGIVEEEFQTEYVVDRTNTFGSAFLGLTVGCAKCHDHKFDPISQKNYYELFSFFNNVREAGQISWDDATPSPSMLLPSVQKERLLAYLGQQADSGRQHTQQLRDSLEPAFLRWVHEAGYRRLTQTTVPQQSLDAAYRFDQSNLTNSMRPSDKGMMKRESFLPGDAPAFVPGYTGKGILLDGDTWLDLSHSGVFERYQPFTIGIRVNIPAGLAEGVLLHKSQAERLYNFRGYYLYLKNSRLELGMAHAAPSNAIDKVMIDTVPRNRWIQLAITYDGSSKAAGLNLYIDGRRQQMTTVSDQLDKSILFTAGNIMRSDHRQPGLQVGAWWRGHGFTHGKIDDILVYHRELSPVEISWLAGDDAALALTRKAPDQLTSPEMTALRDYYFSAIDGQMKTALSALEKQRGTLCDSTENVDELMVMQEMAVPKKTHILLRGNYDSPGEEVSPNTPASILPFAKGLSRNRLGLAQWLTDARNPLTARVAVNRLWQNFFGTGIVKTAEDFGNQGEMPSHSALLDWLATTFRESGWDIKNLNRLIVLSATYRQDSRGTKEDMAKDPANRLLARGASGRMSAEMIRDNALKACGLLNERLGGKSVKPYQPDGLWEINNTSYTRDSGDAVYRRSVYVIVKRSVPNPTLATFDAGSRSYCILRRQSTNTPLQALVTLNDPCYVEASRALGEQMCSESDLQQAVAMVYRKLTGQQPEPRMTTLLLSLRNAQLAKFRAKPAAAAGWLNTGQYRININRDAMEVAANAVVASTIMNSDASLSKR